MVASSPLPVRCATWRTLPFTIAFASAQLVAASADKSDLLAMIDDNFNTAAAQYAGMLASVKDHPGLPRSSHHGKVITVPPTDWTSGFFPGSLWLIYDHTRDPKWEAAAREYTQRLEKIKFHTSDHDTGFMLGCSYGQGLRLTGDPAYRAVLLQGADSLASRHSPKTGLIRSWDFSVWKYPVIVDNMMNLELLMWASEAGGKPALRDIATSHADKTLVNHYRANASSVHVVDFDPETGAVLARQTHQGTSDDSAWARGQAWGFYGFVMMYRTTRDPRYLAQAKRIAAFLIDHPRMPEDGVPYWDFDAPGIPDAPRDASAAAIMASALIELGGFVQTDEAGGYRGFAERQLRSLSSPVYRAAIGENSHFILKHATGNMPAGTEIDVPLNYADYYFLEALLRLKAQVGGSYP